MSSTQLLSQLESNSLRVFTETSTVRLDGTENPDVEQTYLMLDGTPQAFRWLAALLGELAHSAEQRGVGASVVVSPRDLKQVALSEWSALDVRCRHVPTDE